MERSSGRDLDRLFSGCILGSSSSSSPGSSGIGELLPPEPRLESESVCATSCLWGGELLGKLKTGSNTSETGVSMSELPSVSSTELCESMEDRLAFRKRSSVVRPRWSCGCWGLAGGRLEMEKVPLRGLDVAYSSSERPQFSVGSLGRCISWTILMDDGGVLLHGELPCVMPKWMMRLRAVDG